MADQDKIQELIDASEDALFQKIIDRQEGALGLEELNQCGAVPTQAELARWEQALNKLVDVKAPGTTPGKKRLGRTALLAILAAALLLVAASALSRPILNWVESVHEQYTQLQAKNTAQDEIDSWSGYYLPTSLPAHFAVSDAHKADDVAMIEYANTEGFRITFYQYSPHSSFRIDTEKADKVITDLIPDQNVYLFSKKNLSAFSWNCGGHLLSIEFNTGSVEESELRALIGSIQWQQ